MVRYSLLLLVGLASASSTLASSWADSMFDGLSRDFGSVPRGPILSHPFRVTNRTDRVIQIGQIRVSCGCVTATPTQTQLAPGETAAPVAARSLRGGRGNCHLSTNFSPFKNFLYAAMAGSPKAPLIRFDMSEGSDAPMLMPTSFAPWL